MQKWEEIFCNMLEEHINRFVVHLHYEGLIVDNQIRINTAEAIYYRHFSIVIARNMYTLFLDASTVANIIYYSEELGLLTGVSARKATGKIKVVVSQFSTCRDPRATLPPEKLIDETFCRLCSVKFSNAFYSVFHKLHGTHIVRQQYVSAKERSTAFTRNPEIIAVEVESGHTSLSESITLRPNESKTLRIINRTGCDFQLSDVIQINLEIREITVNSGLLPCVLPAGQQLIQTISSHFITERRSIILAQVFVVKMLGKQEELKILKELIIHLEPHFEAVAAALLPSAPFQRRNPVYREYTKRVVPGEKILMRSKFNVVIPLEHSELPDEVVTLLNTGLEPFEHMTEREVEWLDYLHYYLTGNPNEAVRLTVDTYSNLLEIFLYLEEHQMAKDIHDYDSDDQILFSVLGRPNFYELHVPGLAEHKPSLVRGDSVFVKEDPESELAYEGVVHEVKETSVILGFSYRFTADAVSRNKTFTVNYAFDRTTIRVEHQASAFAFTHNVTRFLFPTLELLLPPRTEEFIYRWYEEKISANVQQQDAVRCIVENTSMPAPFLIFGPPGTGKTMTMAEAIKQVWKLKPNANILVCAPSNSAVNEITKRLITDIPRTDLLRYMSPRYRYYDVPPELFGYVNHDHGELIFPTLEELMEYRIITSTLMNSSRLINGGIPPAYFSYIFIDESGQATESETLIPISGFIFAMENTLPGQIVLAGDPKQLGPVIHSKLAMNYGYGISMLERLMNSDLYKKDRDGMYNPRVLVKLLHNYRSHPTMLRIPNELFYDGELIPSGDDKINAGLNWEHLPNPKFPIIFHNMNGAEEREHNSPSFFNIEEALTICDYVKKLLDSGLPGMRIYQCHIAVVTPYRKQVEKIRRAFELQGWTNITVGSVEQIQGQERLIVIVSTVRSKAKYFQYDNRFQLGFLKNEKRFNVALTRAKALQIIVGNADLLQVDPNWKRFIDYCIENGGFTGNELKAPPSEAEMEDLAGGFEELLRIEDLFVGLEGPSFARGNV